MRVVLEIISGVAEGKRFWLRAGQSVDIGRSDHAAFAVPHDPHMSAVHFRVECDGQECRLRDLNSSNGTTVNGQKVNRGVLRDGDQVVAGETRFLVRIEGAPTSAPGLSPSDQEAILGTHVPQVASGRTHRVGHWHCHGVPEDWDVLPDRGIRSTAQEAFPTSLIFVESARVGDVSLPQHVDALIQQYVDVLPGVRSGGVRPEKIAGADEACRFLLEYPDRGGVTLLQCYVCVRQDDVVGMAVMTTSRDEWERSGKLFDQVLTRLIWERD
jgi:pSer/pThr/pTyr-binding forkhead associated (FHA) protein